MHYVLFVEMSRAVCFVLADDLGAHLAVVCTKVINTIPIIMSFFSLQRDVPGSCVIVLGLYRFEF